MGAAKRFETKAEIVDHLAEKFGLTKKTATGVVNEFSNMLGDQIKRSGTLTFPGIGKVAVSNGKSGDRKTPTKSQTPRARRRSIDSQSLDHEPVRSRLPELHDETTGRIDAVKVANFLGITLSQVAAAVGVKYQTLHKTPTSESAQKGLALIKRCLEILDEYFHEPATIRAWLNCKNADLGMRTPIEVIREGYADAVYGMLAASYYGIPS
ncbi:HU family DNA-binding protein [bacterium]|nr:HU family DNA-binding protein [bacterium]